MTPLRLVCLLCSLFSATLPWRSAHASGAPIYAILIGNNAAPASDPSLPALQFADDDASRFYTVLSRAKANITLLAVLDARTQARFPGLAKLAQLPSQENLARAFADIRLRVAADKANGKRPVVFVTFSGHGAFGEEGEPFLALFDGNLTRSELFSRHLSSLRDTQTHLIVDACHAGAMVGVRGPIVSERDASSASLSAEETQRLSSASLLDAYPNVGVIAAASSNQEAHEWSQIESGVFTHEVLSALLGAADVNGDQRIEYSEVQAFVSAANRGISDVRARARIIARPPSADRHAVLMDLHELEGMTFLHGPSGEVGHFQVEVDGVGAWLDAHPAKDAPLWLAVPRNERAFLRGARGEARLPTESPKIAFAALQFEPLSTHARGSVDAALRHALFTTAYGPAYYTGFVDSADLPSVRFAPHSAASQGAERGSFRLRRGLAITTLTVGSLATVSAVVFGALAIDRRSHYNDTSFMREARDIEGELRRFRGLAIASGAVAAGAGVATYLLWPRVDPATGSVAAVFAGRF